jgi:hypothetical protein
MEQLIEDLIEHLMDSKKQELKNIEYLKHSDNKQSDIKDLMLITSGKILEMESIIRKLREMLRYHMQLN